MSAVNETLRISLFGEIKITKGTQHFPAFPTQKSRSLFTRLVLDAGRIFPRDYLAEFLCGESDGDKARKCLRTELWRVRRVLGSAGDCSENYLLVDNNGISFNGASNYWLDVAEFQSTLAQVRHREQTDFTQLDCHSLKKCIDLYSGDLLSSMSGDWYLLHREELRSQYLIALELLVLYYMSNRDWNNAIIYANQLLSKDGLLEHIHLYLMRCYCAKGNRPAAVMQYQRCKKLLSDELGVSPMPETEHAYLDIIRRIPSPQPDPQLSDSNFNKVPESLMSTFKQVLCNIRSAEKILVQAEDRFLK